LPNLWGSPEYRFRVPRPDDPSGNELQEIIIDVTLSAPSFDEPSDSMKDVLNGVTEEYLGEGARALDFGAGKLRNSLYLLRRGHAVCGVEFKKLSETEHGKAAYARAQRYNRFWTLVYPHEFFTSKSKFDLALLINVLNIMPIQGERTIVVQECYSKLNSNGYLLWYSQYGDPDYKKRCTDDVRLGDGYYIGKTRKFKTFYREFSSAEMDSMMLANGFTFVKSYPVSHNHVRLYQKAEINPLGSPLTRKALKLAIPVDKTIELPEAVRPKIVERGAGVSEVRPDPPMLSQEMSLIAGLKTISAGPKSAHKYHSLVKAILELVFAPTRLRKIVTEQGIFEGRKRIDLLSRTGKDGFFATLPSSYRIHAPFVFIECKNYSEDINNPEFDQLKGRMSDIKGHFGLLVCREIHDRGEITARCHDAIEAGHYIIVLDDKDLENLLKLHFDNDLDGIDNYLDDMLGDILLQPNRPRKTVN
jgi:hypothetical protein